MSCPLSWQSPDGSFKTELRAVIWVLERICFWLGYRAWGLGQCLLHPVGHGKSVYPEEQEVQ